MLKPDNFDKSIFINCPFDALYRPILWAVIFSILACGYKPCSALQEDDAGTVRLDKIRRLISGSRLGIHDISRTEIDVVSGLPRFNMPFELGLDLGARMYGRGYLARKQILILDKERYRYRQFLSDIAGQDISNHDNLPELAIERVRSWLNALREHERPLKGPARINQLYRDFTNDLPHLAIAATLDAESLDFNDFHYFAKGWVALNA
jgi:hypothetical protein